MTRGRLAPLLPVALAGGLALSFVPFLNAGAGNPTSADAVVVLSGDHGERLPLALALIDGGVTSTLVFAGTLDSAQGIELCKGGQPFEVLCLKPDPDNTREEARAVGRLAASRGWKTLVVVTTRHHVPRSQRLFDRCLDGEVVLMGADPRYGVGMVLRNLAREWLGVIRSLTIARGC